MWPALRSRESRLDFVAGSLPDGVTVTRASKAWGFNEFGKLTEYAANEPVHDYDPSLVYNEVRDPWANGGTIGGALPDGWPQSASGVAFTLTARGTTDDGLPYFRIRFAGTATNTNSNAASFSNAANRECPISVGEVFSGWVRARLVAVTQPLGALFVQAVLIETRDSGPVGGARSTLGNLSLTEDGVFYGARAATTSDVTGGALAIWFGGQTTGQEIDFEVEVVFPVTSRGYRPANDYASIQELAQTDAYGRTYGRRGLLTEPPATNLVLDPRFIGVTAGAPGSFSSDWGYVTPDATGGLTRTLSLTTEDGIPSLDIRWAGTTTSANLQLLLSFIKNSSNTVAVGETYTASVCARLVAGAFPVAPVLRIQEGGAAVWSATDEKKNIGGGPLRAQRFSTKRVITRADATYANMVLLLTISTIGTVVDFTMRVGLPMLTKTAFLVNPILPDEGATGQSSTQLTSVSLDAYGAANMAEDSERIMELSMEIAQGSTGGLFWCSGADINERDMLFVDPATGRLNYQVYRSGARRLNTMVTSDAVNGDRRFLTAAIQQKRNAYGASYAAASPSAYALDYAIPPATSLRLARHNTGDQVAGWIRSFRHWHEAGDKAALVQVGAAADDGTGETLRGALAKVQTAMGDLFGSLAAPAVLGTGAPGSTLDQEATQPSGASYLDVGEMVWWRALAAQSEAAWWSPSGAMDHPGYVSGRWYGANVNSNGSHAPDAGRLYLTPQYISRAVTISHLAIRSSSTMPTAGKVRLGIYRSDPDSADAYDLVAEAPTDITVDTANTAYSVALASPVTLMPGVYWFALVIDTSGPTVVGEGHGSIQSGGPSAMRGAVSATVRGMLAGAQYGNTSTRSYLRSYLQYNAGAAFLPKTLTDVTLGSNTPASPLIAWKAA